MFGTLNIMACMSSLIESALDCAAGYDFGFLISDFLELASRLDVLILISDF